MKKLLFLFLPLALLAETARSPEWVIESTVQARLGLDNNPVGAGASTVAVLGEADATVTSGSLALAVGKTYSPTNSLKFTYTGETFIYDGWSSEDYTTHRFGVVAQMASGMWKFSADGSSLWIDGNKDTLLSLGASNANATALWRERRAQWQHRLKLLAQRESGPQVLRFSAALLAYDYRTHVVSGYTGFADRRDFNGGADWGWKFSPSSLALLGARVGTQHQDQLALSGGQFDYSSRYLRTLAGWEGKLGSATSVSLLAGPEFRHYTGDVDTRVFSGRDRTSLWIEASGTAKVGKQLALTAKVTRWVWLSSTGKSTYTDLAFDTGATWTVSPVFALRATCKIQQSAYSPVARDDWQGLTGVGATWKITPQLQATADALVHRAWNERAGTTEREFHRSLFSIGLGYKF